MAGHWLGALRSKLFPVGDHFHGELEGWKMMPSFEMNYDYTIFLGPEGGVTRVEATEKRNVNVSKSVTMEHCFNDEGK